MKAKKKKIESLKPADLGLDFVSCILRREIERVTHSVRYIYHESQSPRMEVVSVSEPPKRVGGGKVSHYIGRTQLGSKLKARNLHNCLGGERRGIGLKIEGRRNRLECTISNRNSHTLDIKDHA